MKKILVLLCVAMLALATTANASIIFGISPTGQIDTSAMSVGDEVFVSITMDIDTTYYFKAGQFRLQLDTTEVLPLLDKSGKPTLTNTEVQDIIGLTYANNEVFFSIGNTTGYDTVGAGSYNIATATLLLQDPSGPWDGADVILGASAADGMYNWDGSVQYCVPAPMDGPDYGKEGGPVIPIPGAVYLFLSGLVGLIGLHRKNR